MDELELILTLFAELIVKYNGDSKRAAIETCQGNQDHATYLIDNFRWDSRVLTKIAEYEQIKAEVVPTREEVLKSLWETAQGKFTDPKAKVLALQLYSEILGYVGKTSKVEVNNVPKVMIIKDKGDDWESKAVKQQQAMQVG
jgi:hypothetical protein